MVAGHLQQKKGYWYIVLNLHDETGKRHTKWIATHLPVEGNERRAEELLFEARQQHIDPYGLSYPSGLLFTDYMLQWLAKIESRVSPTTYRNYKYVVENSICLYFREQKILLAELRPSDLEEYYSYLEEARRFRKYCNSSPRKYSQGLERCGPSGLSASQCG